VTRFLCGTLALALLGCTVEDVSDDSIRAPFAVSDYFVPSGFMGDASVLGRDPERHHALQAPLFSRL